VEISPKRELYAPTRWRSQVLSALILAGLRERVAHERKRGDEQLARRLDEQLARGVELTTRTFQLDRDLLGLRRLRCAPFANRVAAAAI
jgi:hypothetical protein